ncbi:hypothetical protein GJ744_005851 [Endocarpon pusillum]|uniref:Uncharacterized protein n=1 Tax=Endocarpon pusillum TaxID=364733 RepID=A0A8H7A7J3_9EURO|nr:hypothetical protein GJ744_005851 [Endocarpon pusillum]
MAIETKRGPPRLIHSDAARAGALKEHRSIKVSTYGIIFMGNPHQGGSGVQLGKLMVNIASVFVAADDQLVKHLERDSEWFQQQLGPNQRRFCDQVCRWCQKPRRSCLVWQMRNRLLSTRIISTWSKDDNGYRMLADSRIFVSLFPPFELQLKFL